MNLLIFSMKLEIAIINNLPHNIDLKGNLTSS